MADALDDLLANIADGEPIDWERAAHLAHGSGNRELLAQLKVIAVLSDTHATAQDDVSTHEGGLMVSGGDHSRSPSMTGRFWGKYLLVERIGEGGFGDVFRAHDRQLHRDLAIKLLHVRGAAHDQLPARLLREAKDLAKVRHPNVVSIYGVEEHAGQVGLGMEFVKGQTLEARARAEGPLSAEEAVIVGRAVCRGLAAVHQAGLLHRDVKAKNVMRELGGRIVVMDLGAGLDTSDADRMARAGAAGTPLYMAPEVLLYGRASVESDIYSTGVLLYFLATGRYPVEGESAAALRRNHAERRRTPLSERRLDLPDRFVQVVEKALASDPTERYSTANELLAALADGPPAPLPESTWAHAPSVPSMVLGVGTLLIVLGGINSRYFNMTLGRTEYANEGPVEWLYFGLLSCVAPAVILGFGVSAVSVAVAVRSLTISAWAPARRADAAAGALLGRLRLDTVPACSGLALVLSGTVLALTWWHSLPVLQALLGIFPEDVSTVPAHRLAFLGPEYAGANQEYRLWFAVCTFVCVAAWVPTIRLAARQRQRINRLVAAGGVVIFALSLALLDFPYRLLVQSALEVATWQGQECFVLGERASNALLFCPTAPPPRNHTVSVSSPDLKRHGMTGPMFHRIREAN